MLWLFNNVFLFVFIFEIFVLNENVIDKNVFGIKVLT